MFVKTCIPTIELFVYLQLMLIYNTNTNNKLY